MELVNQGKLKSTTLLQCPWVCDSLRLEQKKPTDIRHRTENVKQKETHTDNYFQDLVV